MNLLEKPTQQELQELFAEANDDNGHHILWVDVAGKVRLSLLPEDEHPNGFQEQDPSMVLRYETFGQSNGYVGPDAAEDEEHIGSLYRSLIKEWANRPAPGRSRYIDVW